MNITNKSYQQILLFALQSEINENNAKGAPIIRYTIESVITNM